MPAGALSESAQRRVRADRVTLFIAATVAAFPLALLPPAAPSKASYVLAAAVVFAIVGLAIVFVPWTRFPDIARFSMVMGFCLGVAFLRESGGGAVSGYSSLLLIPVIWQALYGRTADLVLTVVTVALTLVVPIVTVGGETYPTNGLRGVVLTTMTYSLVGITVHNLIEKIRRHEDMLSAVVALTRGLTDTEHIRDRLCTGIVQIVGADIAVFSETDGTGRLRVTASTDHQAAAPFLDAPDSWKQVLGLEEGVFRSRTQHDQPPFRSVLHQPIRRGTHGVGLVTLGWSTPRRQPPSFARQAVALVATEAATAVERADLIERVTRLARHDDLTGLANRRTWDEQLKMEISRADRTATTMAVALIDLDHFKRYNDEHGHLAGDRLLKAAAAAWSSQLRPTDVLARWGGEEFALALPNTNLDGALQVLERLRPMTPMGQTFSAGVTVVEGRDPMTVMQSADSALYLAKESGRDRVVAFDSHDHERKLASAAGT